MSEQSDKLSTVLLAASALAELGGGSSSGSDEESSKAKEQSNTTEQQQPIAPRGDAEQAERSSSTKSSEMPTKQLQVPAERHLPKHKKANAALTFPEKLFQMLSYAEEQLKSDPNFCVSWTPDGLSFAVSDPEKFTCDVVPLFFKPTKFSSFTRKLYRWGFYQLYRPPQEALNGSVAFSNKHFQRDAKHLMSKMKSTTAQGNQGEPKALGAPPKTPRAMALNGGATTRAEQLLNLSGTKRGFADIAPSSESSLLAVQGLQMPGSILSTTRARRAAAAAGLNTNMSVLGPAQKIRMLQMALDCSTDLIDTSGNDQQQSLSASLNVGALKHTTPAASFLNSERTTTLADRLRAAHNRPSLRRTQQEQKQLENSSEDIVARAREAALRSNALAGLNKFDLDSHKFNNNKFDLACSGDPMTLRSLMMHPQGSSATGAGAAGGFAASMNNRSSADIVKAAIDALRNAA